MRFSKTTTVLIKIIKSKNFKSVFSIIFLDYFKIFNHQKLKNLLNLEHT